MTLRDSMQLRFKTPRNRAIAQARALLRQCPVIFDTETTGLEDEAEICEIAIIRHTGEVVLDTRVRPVGSISLEATSVHGIGDEHVADAPSLGNVLAGDILEMMLGPFLTSYNLDFDLRLIRQSASVAGCYDILQAAMEMGSRSRVNCLMQLYARYYGARESRYRGHKWQSLEDAAEQQRLVWENPAHSALGDARMALKVLEAIAGAEYA